MPMAEWETIIEDWPSSTPTHRAIHLILLYHDQKWKVLAFGIGDGPPHARTTACYLFDLDNISNAASATVITNPWTDLFCAGHCHLENGDVLFAGGGFILGHYLPPFDLNKLDLTGEQPQWVRLRPMNHPRWYPTCTILPEGQVLISSGLREFYHSTYSGNVEIPELYDPVVNVCVEVPTANRYERPRPGWPLPPFYPFTFISLGGLVLETGPGNFTGWHDTTTWRWHHENFGFEGGARNAGVLEGSAVCFEPGKFMRAGGALRRGRGSARTAVLKLDEEPPWVWERADDMTYGRRHLDLVLLPNKRVLAAGGAVGGHIEGSYSRRIAEIFDPEDPSKHANGSWTADPPSVTMEEPRGYHSAALLLPDARVLVAGGEPGTDGGHPIDPNTAQIYRPPYLDGDPPRLMLKSGPQRLVYGAEHQLTIEMEDGITDYEVSRVCLIKLGAVTHGFDQDQRYIHCDHEEEYDDPNDPERTLLVTAPPNAAHAPPGPYMLFVLVKSPELPFPDVEVPCRLAAHVLLGNERVLVQSGQIDIIEGSHPFDPTMAHGSLWNPDLRYFEIASPDDTGIAVVELGSEVASTTP